MAFLRKKQYPWNRIILGVRWLLSSFGASVDPPSQFNSLHSCVIYISLRSQQIFSFSVLFYFLVLLIQKKNRGEFYEKKKIRVRAHKYTNLNGLDFSSQKYTSKLRGKGRS